MSLGYGQIQAIAGNQALLAQMSTAILKQALTKIGAATGNELALCSAIIKSPTSYASRFLLDALVQNAAVLTSSTVGNLDSAVSDSVIDSTVTAQWASQWAAGA